MTEKTILFSFRVPKELKEAFEYAAKVNDHTASQAMRQLMRAYIAEAGHNALMRQLARKAQS